MSDSQSSAVPQADVEALVACLMPHPEALGSRAGSFRAWLTGVAEGWVRGGFDGPAPGSAQDSGGPPDAAAADLDEIDLVRAANAEDLRHAAEWAAGTQPFLAAERRAALTLLADCLAIGAGPHLPAFLPEGGAEAILSSFPDSTAPSATLWRPAAGRRTSDLWSAILWNRIASDPQELHSGPECVAALVAVAEMEDRTVGELLDAIVVGCGVGGWHRDAVGGAMERSGVHSPGALGPVAAAAAVGRLTRMSARNLAQSLRRASALTPFHPYRTFVEGHRGRLLYGAFGQLLGTAAALTIKSPIGTLPAPPLSRRSKQEDAPAFDARAATRAIHAVALKKFPGSRALQSTLAAIEKLPRIAPDAIASITVETYPWSTVVSGWSRPDTGPIAMQTHIPTATALMLQARHRRAPFEAELYPKTRDAATVALAERIEVVSREFGEPGAPPTRRTRFARVIIRPKAGAVLTASSSPPFAPPPPGAIRDRFANLAHGAAVRDPHQCTDRTPVRELFAAAASSGGGESAGGDAESSPEPSGGGPETSEGNGGDAESRTSTLFGQQ